MIMIAAVTHLSRAGQLSYSSSTRSIVVDQLLDRRVLQNARQGRLFVSPTTLDSSEHCYAYTSPAAFSTTSTTFSG